MLKSDFKNELNRSQTVCPLSSLLNKGNDLRRLQCTNHKLNPRVWVLNAPIFKKGRRKLPNYKFQFPHAEKPVRMMNVKEIHMCYTTYIKLHKNKTGSTQTAIKIVLIRIYMKFIHILFFF